MLPKGWLSLTTSRIIGARETVTTLQGLLQRGDRLMGSILDALDDAGLSENTVVVMCVDHGVGAANEDDLL